MQSKKRGLSLEEKREKIMEVFHETKDVFQLKVTELFIKDSTWAWRPALS